MAGYMVCCSCGHIEAIDPADDRPFVCENCGHGDGHGFESLQQSLAYSDRVLGPSRGAA